MAPQVALTMPILPGTDGHERMSKSVGNYVGVTEPPEEQFGKLMSVPDEAMETFYRLLFPAEPPPAGHPGQEKRRLGRLVADRFHGPGAGSRAEEYFDRTVRDRQAPDDAPEIALPPGPVHLPALLVEHLGSSSRSDARRLLTQGGVTLDGDALMEIDVDAAALDGRILRARRRFLRVRVSR
jgi:tyrosyl-tRNA synthetase